MLISPWEYSGSTLSPNSSHLPMPGLESKRRPKDEINDDINHHTTVKHATDTLCGQIQTAFDLNRAFTDTKYSSPFGHCLTRYEEKNPPTLEHQKVLKQMRDVYRDMPQPYKYGWFEESFHLKITRPGCEYEGLIQPRSYTIEKLLPEWYEHAAIAGYGDFKVLTTKVDRNAKEITADKFIVDRSLLDRIRAIWAEYFIPGAVRVEPYKIHLYGPGGHFKSHRDTLEPGLVGMFLVGLGDTSARSVYESGRRRYEGNFCIGDEKLAATSCSWVAFHSDMPHAVSKLCDHGYRAVIVFKLFHDAGPAKLEGVARELKVRDRMSNILADIPLPYGFLLDHRYRTGISKLSGYDAILLSAAKQRQGTVVHILPVVIRSHSTTFFRHRYDDEKDDYHAWVYPFTSAHVDLVLSNGENVEAQKRAFWFKGISGVPFFSRDFVRSTEQWRGVTEAISYTGNESDGIRENSIYLSYALLVLPDSGDESSRFFIDLYT